VVEWALKFGPADYFSLMVLAFVTVSAVLGSSAVRGLAALFFGIWLGLIGVDLQTGQARFTFGLPELLDGINVIVVAVGLFAVGETLYVASRYRLGKDEIIPLQDYRVQSNRAYLVIVLLSRVITKLGDYKSISVDTVENLFSTDLAYLQEFYRKINEEGGAPKHHVTCPKCQHEMDIDMVTGAVLAEDGGSGQSGPG
jgi:hypothetical protein